MHEHIVQVHGGRVGGWAAPEDCVEVGSTSSHLATISPFIPFLLSFFLFLKCRETCFTLINMYRQEETESCNYDITQFSVSLPSYMPKNASMKNLGQFWPRISGDDFQQSFLNFAENNGLQASLAAEGFRDPVSTFSPPDRPFMSSHWFPPGSVCPWNRARSSDSRRERGGYSFSTVGGG